MTNKNSDDMDLKDILKKQFENENVKEIIIISVHGIETIIKKDDELEEKNNFLYIMRKSGDIEIITFADSIFKIIVNKIHNIPVQNIRVI